MCGTYLKKLFILSLLMVTLSSNLFAWFWEECPKADSLQLETEEFIPEVVGVTISPAQKEIIPVIAEMDANLSNQELNLQLMNANDLLNKSDQFLAKLQQDMSADLKNYNLLEMKSESLENNLKLLKQDFVINKAQLRVANDEIDYLKNEKERMHLGLGLLSSLSFENGLLKPDSNLGGGISLRKENLMFTLGALAPVDSIVQNATLLKDVEITAGVYYEF